MNDRIKSTAERSMDITGLFEAEVLIQLMLSHWNHPYAGDEDFARQLLDDAAHVLREAIEEAAEVVEGVPPRDLNFIAAVWCAENRAVEPGRGDPATLPARKAWLDAVRRSLPSCFCDPDILQ